MGPFHHGSLNSMLALVPPLLSTQEDLKEPAIASGKIVERVSGRTFQEGIRLEVRRYCVIDWSVLDRIISNTDSERPPDVLWVAKFRVRLQIPHPPPSHIHRRYNYQHQVGIAPTPLKLSLSPTYGMGPRHLLHFFSSLFLSSSPCTSWNAIKSQI